MISSLVSKTDLPDRVKLPFLFDRIKMQEEAQALRLANFEYYNVMPLRAPAHLVDTSLPLPPPAEDYADGSWTEWLNTVQLDQSPYLTSIVGSFAEHTTVNLVRLLRLAPKAEVPEHCDPTLGLEEEKSMIRLTIPIYNKGKVEFILNDRVVDMNEGECWYLRLTDKHKVINYGDEERINLTLDVIPNEYIRELINRAI